MIGEWMSLLSATVRLINLFLSPLLVGGALYYWTKGDVPKAQMLLLAAIYLRVQA